ncbi:MAG: DUF4870 domain-containing protein [Candidatus Omnitrophica bacterium]|nr:DUF4870 domain-containing protein [Candidatus Omnitrophota bacterium]
MEAKDLGKTSTGIQPNVSGLLSYAAGIVSGIIFYVIEKENKFVKFHAVQSIVTFGGFLALWIGIAIISQILIMLHVYGLLQLFHLINILLWLASFILWVVLMIKAYQGEKFKLPVIGDIAEKKSQ